MRGATSGDFWTYEIKRHFNSRTPCGARLEKGRVHILEIILQSTHPMRGATLLPGARLQGCKLQSTHPMRGATR